MGVLPWAPCLLVNPWSTPGRLTHPCCRPLLRPAANWDAKNVLCIYGKPIEEYVDIGASEVSVACTLGGGAAAVAVACARAACCLTLFGE